jgi:hypothetical protein
MTASYAMKKNINESLPALMRIFRIGMMIQKTIRNTPSVFIAGTRHPLL